MPNPDLARAMHEQRQLSLRSLARIAEVRSARASRGRALRRSVGRAVVRIGLAIESEPRQPVASR